LPLEAELDHAVGVGHLCQLSGIGRSFRHERPYDGRRPLVLFLFRFFLFVLLLFGLFVLLFFVFVVGGRFFGSRRAAERSTAASEHPATSAALGPQRRAREREDQRRQDKRAKGKDSNAHAILFSATRGTCAPVKRLQGRYLAKRIRRRRSDEMRFIVVVPV
jgi:hypothetical protein